MKKIAYGFIIIILLLTTLLTTYSYDIIKVMLFNILMVLTFAFDLETMKIPNKLVLAGLLIGVITLFIPTSANLTIADRMMGAFAGGGSLFIVHVLTRGFGLGDVKILFVIGLFMGLHATFKTLIVALMLSSIVALYLLLRKKATLKSKIPFGPFIAISSTIMIYFVY